MEIVVASIQSTRNTDLGILVRPIQSSLLLPALPTIHGGIPCHISLPPSKLDRSTGISECADNDHWALVRPPRRVQCRDRKADRATAPW